MCAWLAARLPSGKRAVSFFPWILPLDPTGAGGIEEPKVSRKKGKGVSIFREDALWALSAVSARVADETKNRSTSSKFPSWQERSLPS